MSDSEGSVETQRAVETGRPVWTAPVVLVREGQVVEFPAVGPAATGTAEVQGRSPRVDLNPAPTETHSGREVSPDNTLLDSPVKPVPEDSGMTLRSGHLLPPPLAL